jgi:guanylate kinase
MNNIRSLFVMIAGPSAVGKNTIIKKIQELDDRFYYPKVLTDRPARLVDEKHSITSAEFDKKEKSGELLYVEVVYGSRYAILKEDVIDAVENGKILIVDTQFDLELNDYDNLKIYILPTSLLELKRKLKVYRGEDREKRYKKDSEELKMLRKIKFQSFGIDQVIVNYNSDITAKEILRNANLRLSGFAK